MRKHTRTSAPTAAPTPVAAYKALLRDILDRRPSGMRARIADALGRHKSFVSQLTNPIYPVPIPARHLPVIFELCHLSPEEQHSFLGAYERAHPARGPSGERTKREPQPRKKTLTVEI